MSDGAVPVNLDGLDAFAAVLGHSQCGEEGVLVELFLRIGHGDRYAVDLGASDGTTNSNTRWLAEHHGWRVLRIDGNPSYAAQSRIHWLSSGNVCAVLAGYSVPAAFDLLSIDLDGCDLWIVRALHNGGYRPRAMLVEVNSHFDPDVSRCVPDEAARQWNGRDSYYGASFAAWRNLAAWMAYVPVACLMSQNLLLVRRDLVSGNPAGAVLCPRKIVHAPHPTDAPWTEV